MKYPLASNSWDDREIEAINSVIRSDMYTMGSKVKKFEDEFAFEIGSKHAVMVNSGSSANLLMLTALSLKENLGCGDYNIIVPAIGWSTTYFPVHQIGGRLNFVDVSLSTLNIDPEKVIKAINSETKAILAVNLLGNPADLIRLRAIADAHDIILIEDNCESFGATLDSVWTGTYGKMGTFSFFFSHHLQTMEGGMIVTDDDDLNDILRSIRAHGWVRDMSDNNKWYQKTGDPFKEPYTFALPGYSVRPLEMSGAIGSVQLLKWKSNVAQRRNNANEFLALFQPENWCQTQEQLPGALSSWYGFSLLINNRDELVKHLMSLGVQLRPIMSGNMLNQPVMKYFNNPIIPKEGCPVADTVDDNGFFIGNHPRNVRYDLKELHNIIETEFAGLGIVGA